MVDFVTMFITPFQQAEGCFKKPRSNDTITTQGKPFAKFTFNTHSFNDFPRFQAGKATLITRSPKSQHLHPQARLMENGLGEINIPKECSFIFWEPQTRGLQISRNYRLHFVYTSTISSVQSLCFSEKFHQQ